MVRQLTANVWVDDTFWPSGTSEDRMPPDVVERIGDHAWSGQGGTPASVGVPTSEPALVPGSVPAAAVDDDSDPGDDEDEVTVRTPVGTPPPAAGPGSSTKAWGDYAEANGVSVAPDAKRDEVIAALTAAGIPVE